MNTLNPLTPMAVQRACPARAAGPGSVYQRCGCRGPDGRQLGRRCPALSKETHGTWTVDLWLPGGTGLGKARRLRSGGYRTRAEADRARKALVRAPAGRQRAAAWTTGAWLQHWLASDLRWRASTLKGYTSHVSLYLEPYLGRVPLDELTVQQVQVMFDDLAGGASAKGRRLSASTLARLQGTLRAALNAAVLARYLALAPDRPDVVVKPMFGNLGAYTDDNTFMGSLVGPTSA